MDATMACVFGCPCPVQAVSPMEKWRVCSHRCLGKGVSDRSTGTMLCRKASMDTHPASGGREVKIMDSMGLHVYG
eukprot:1160729-Pelagomonas_calceolata.AAC.14